MPWVKHVAAYAVALGLVAVAPAAHAEGAGSASEAAAPLTSGESAALARGESVVREQTVEIGGRRYVGGLTYTIVDATADELEAMLEDVDAYERVLPRTKGARLIAKKGDDLFIELNQGNALMSAKYTIRVHAEPETANKRELRFWLVPSRPHGIDDAWGFFRLQPFVSSSGAPRVLLTYGVLVDIGPGIVRDLFEERLRAAALSVPQLVRRYVAQVRRGG